MFRNKTAFSILPAFHGDCIFIKTFNNDNQEVSILIDGGAAQTFKYSLKRELENVTHIDIIILTHIDSDHIAGLINFFKSSLAKKITVGEIWMNYPELVEVESASTIAVGQADSLKDLLCSKFPDVPVKSILCEQSDHIINGIEFKFLSPTTEITKELYRQWENERPRREEPQVKDIAKKIPDYNISLACLSTLPFKPASKIEDDIYNASSISFVLKCPDLSLLLLADSRAEIITQQLIKRGFSKDQPLVVDYVKVSHHGSLNNTSQELLMLINCDNYIISTNGGSANHIHPSRETLARIIYNDNRTDKELKIFFNYDISELKAKIGDFIQDTDLIDTNWNPVFRTNFTGHE